MSAKVDIDRLDALFEDAFNFHVDQHPDAMRLAAIAWERMKLRAETLEKLLDQLKFQSQYYYSAYKHVTKYGPARETTTRRLELVPDAPMPEPIAIKREPLAAAPEAPKLPPPVTPPPAKETTVKSGYKQCAVCSITKKAGLFKDDDGNELEICVFCHRAKSPPPTPPAPWDKPTPPAPWLAAELDRQKRVEFAPIPAELQHFRLTKLEPSEGLNIPTAYGRDYPKK